VARKGVKLLAVYLRGEGYSTLGWIMFAARTFFECNAAHTTGYTMTTNGVSVAAVHAYSQKIDLTFYKEVDTFFELVNDVDIYAYRRR
jgi:hypothetical protein